MFLMPGQYYICREADDNFKVGDLVLVTKLDADEVHFSAGDNSWTAQASEFLAQFELDPEGESKREVEITGLMHAMTDFSTEQKQLETSMQQVASTSTDLVAINNSPVGVKKQLGMFKGQIVKMKRDTLARQERIMALMAEKKALLMAKAEGLTQMVKKVQDVVWAINLYTGSNEMIFQLRPGDAAPPETKITIRQRVLFMDEECAIAAEKGGIDCRSIEEFDKWIVDVAHPEHLQQVLPEPKGIVALRVRRDTKKYSDDARENAIMNEGNKETYFLIRNGSQLFRIHTDLAVYGTLFPTQDEFAEIFSPEFDSRGERQDQTPLRPGTKAYKDVMEAAAKEKAHYMRIVLFLQGLLDRTLVFAPVAGNPVITDRKSADEYLDFVRDAERLLPPAKPGFWNWLQELNDRLLVGSRVVGVFDCYGAGLNGDEKKERIAPPGASLPDSFTLYTLEERAGDGFRLFYERGDKVWRRGEGYVTPERRAACTVYPDDRFIINFDDLNPDDIEYYLQDRISRPDYMFLVPLLKVAREMKRRELEQEAPFKKLLAGAIVQQYGVPFEEAERAVPRLVQWWKFKCRITRALTSNDRKSYAEIISQFGTWKEREQEFIKRQHQVQPIIDHIKSVHPHVIFIGHKTDNLYVALVPANDDNVFVHEQIWRFGRGKKIVLDETREWRLVDRRRENWKKVYSTPRWEQWDLRHHISEVITDPERNALILKGLDDLKKQHQKSASWKKGLRPQPLVLAITVTDFVPSIWYSELCSHVPTSHFLSDDAAEPKIERMEVRWERKQEGVVCRLRSEWGAWSGRSWPWEKKNSEYKVVKLFEEHLVIFHRELQVTQAVDVKARSLHCQADGALEQLLELWTKRREQQAFSKFIQENDPDLWPDEKKKLEHVYYEHRDLLRQVCSFLVDEGQTLDRRSLGWCLDKTRQLLPETRETRFKLKPSDLVLLESELDRDWQISTVTEPEPPKEPFPEGQSIEEAWASMKK